MLVWIDAQLPRRRLASGGCVVGPRRAAGGAQRCDGHDVLTGGDGSHHRWCGVSIGALDRISEKALPVVRFGAGLPHVAALNHTSSASRGAIPTSFRSGERHVEYGRRLSGCGASGDSGAIQSVLAHIVHVACGLVGDRTTVHRFNDRERHVDPGRHARRRDDSVFDHS